MFEINETDPIKVRVEESSSQEFFNALVAWSQIAVAVVAILALIFTLIQIWSTFRPIISVYREKENRDNVVIKNTGNRPAYHVKYGTKKLGPLSVPIYANQEIVLESSTSTSEYQIHYSRFKNFGKYKLLSFKEVHLIQKDGDSISWNSLGKMFYALVTRKLNQKFVYSSFRIPKDKYFAAQFNIRQMSKIAWARHLSVNEDYRESEKKFLSNNSVLPYESNLKLREELIFLGFKVKEDELGISIVGAKKIPEDWAQILLKINQAVKLKDNFFQIQESMKGHKKMAWVKGYVSGESGNF